MALAWRSPLFSRRSFDYCIVDEASQVTLPVCLGPLRYADVFVLVGDHYQLPPLVRNAEARDHGFDVSLFRQLSEAHPAATVTLRHQYRMNADLMALANALIYGRRCLGVCACAPFWIRLLTPSAGRVAKQSRSLGGRLRCGSERVATARLTLERWPALAAALHSDSQAAATAFPCGRTPCWVETAVTPRSGMCASAASTRALRPIG